MLSPPAIRPALTGILYCIEDINYFCANLREKQKEIQIQIQKQIQIRVNP
jgi:hypothetical protein